MLKKFILIAGVFGTMATLSAVGCSSSSTTGGNGAGAGDSGSTGDSGKSLKSDGGGKTTGDGGGTVLPGKDGGTISHFDGGGGGDGGPITLSDGGSVSAPACYDVSQAISLTGVGAAAAHQGACTTTQISGYLAACLGSTATDTGCQTFVTANANCATCIGGPSAAATGYAYPVLVPIDSASDVVANVAGCFAALSTGDATCKTNFPALIECEQSACQTCSTDSDNSDCLNYADADSAGCAGFEPVDSTCDNALNTSQASAANQTACGSSAADFEGAYTAVATTLCGP